MMYPDFESQAWKDERQTRWSEWVFPHLKKFARRKELKYLERIYWGEPFDRKSPYFQEYRDKRNGDGHTTLLLLSPHQNSAAWMRDMRPEPYGHLQFYNDLSWLLGINIDHRYYGWDTETAVEWTDLLVTEQLDKDQYAPFGVKEISPFSDILMFLNEYLQPIVAWAFGLECQGEFIKDGNKWAKLNHLLGKLLDISPELIFRLNISESDFPDIHIKIAHARIRKILQKLLFLSFDFENRYESVGIEDSADLQSLGDLTERKLFLAEFAVLLANDPRAAVLYEAASKDNYVVTG